MRFIPRWLSAPVAAGALILAGIAGATALPTPADQTPSAEAASCSTVYGRNGQAVQVNKIVPVVGAPRGQMLAQTINTSGRRVVVTTKARLGHSSALWTSGAHNVRFQVNTATRGQRLELNQVRINGRRVSTSRFSISRSSWNIRTIIKGSNMRPGQTVKVQVFYTVKKGVIFTPTGRVVISASSSASMSYSWTRVVIACGRVNASVQRAVLRQVRANVPDRRNGGVTG